MIILEYSWCQCWGRETI